MDAVSFGCIRAAGREGHRRVQRMDCGAGQRPEKRVRLRVWLHIRSGNAAWISGRQTASPLTATVVADDARFEGIVYNYCVFLTFRLNTRARVIYYTSDYFLPLKQQLSNKRSVSFKYLLTSATHKYLFFHRVLFNPIFLRAAYLAHNIYFMLNR